MVVDLPCFSLLTRMFWRGCVLWALEVEELACWKTFFCLSRGRNSILYLSFRTRWLSVPKILIIRGESYKVYKFGQDDQRFDRSVPGGKEGRGGAEKLVTSLHVQK